MDKTITNNIRVDLRFYGDLNKFLTKKSDGKTFTHILKNPTSVKDLIESFGVPHTEVDLILADDRPVDFSYLVESNERFSIYPFFNSLPISKNHRLQFSQPVHPRFLADVNLGKLARYLRIAGVDTAYRNDARDKELIQQMQKENRILLTRDRKLLMHKVVEKGYLPRSTDAEVQLEEVLERFNLFGKTAPYTRCVSCNGILKPVSKQKILEQLEPLTKQHYQKFSQCRECGQVYWAGSHRERLPQKLRQLLKLET